MSKDEKAEDQEWIEVDDDPQVVVKDVPKKGPVYGSNPNRSLVEIEDDESY